jgi:hypothetical protein
MVRRYLILAALLFCVAAEPPHVTYDPQPPGQIVSNQLVYLAGEGMSSQWRGIVSKKLVGTSAGMSFYQWYLSIYAINGSTYVLKYRSPNKLVPYDTVTRTSDASMWFPGQSGEIVGAGEFMGPGVQQLVVSSHQSGADCGSVRIDIFAYDAKTGNVYPALSIENYCRLDAKIIDGDALQLTGPYYGPKAPTCCPTKPNVSATLRYANGKWLESPQRYFEIVGH